MSTMDHFVKKNLLPSRITLRFLIKFKLLAVLPGRPSTPNVTRTGSDFVDLQWITPEEGDGKLLSHAIALMFNASQQKIAEMDVKENSNKLFSTQLKGLRAFTPYTVWVKARSSIGTGLASNSTSFTTYSK